MDYTATGRSRCSEILILSYTISTKILQLGSVLWHSQLSVWFNTNYSMLPIQVPDDGPERKRMVAQVLRFPPSMCTEFWAPDFSLVQSWIQQQAQGEWTSRYMISPPPPPLCLLNKQVNNIFMLTVTIKTGELGWAFGIVLSEHLVSAPATLLLIQLSVNEHPGRQW